MRKEILTPGQIMEEEIKSQAVFATKIATTGIAFFAGGLSPTIPLNTILFQSLYLRF